MTKSFAASTATAAGGLACVVFGAAAILSPVARAAGVPVAVVEEVKGKASGLEFMDYVEAGRVIKLGPKDTIVLGYLKSCLRETVTGGTVVVGAEQSKVHLGTIESIKVECDAAAQLGERQAAESAATVFRGMGPNPSPNPSAGGTPPAAGEPARTLVLYGRSPVFEVSEPATLTIERLDKVGEKQAIALRAKSLVRGRFYDLAKADKALSPGGSYVATLGGRKVAFRIAPDAKPGATPVVGRLVRFE
ncbi:hypothetical protein [Rhodoplanes roseus]|uniref:Uncharacterized protein n=1 Tax=Rhodoplanes roseus TaxID=29409 RepID=A0A327KI87_9BRAD|nr:hypothetical protein [Rhodoplanes roseus]RAI37814.1 hypothetical protein CH341_28980 [Rhodoplanes roseus]